VQCWPHDRPHAWQAAICPHARRLARPLTGSVTDDDRRQRAEQYWPIRQASNNANLPKFIPFPWLTSSLPWTFTATLTQPSATPHQLCIEVFVITVKIDNFTGCMLVLSPTWQSPHSEEGYLLTLMQCCWPVSKLQLVWKHGSSLAECISWHCLWLVDFSGKWR